MKTPYFLIDKEKLENNIDKFQCALSKYFDKSYVAYSVKTNSLPWIIKYAYGKGCMIEVTSYDEYNLVRSLNIPINKIIYNGPNKNKSTFVEAVNGQALVNVENFCELDWLLDCKEKAKIGIRININLEKISSGKNIDLINGTEGPSRFGLSVENGDFERALEIVKNSGCSLAGIHVHRTSSQRCVETYADMCKYIVKIIAKYNLSLDYIDLGGGYWGDVPTKPKYLDYAKAFYSEFKLLNNNECIIVEPGSAIIASPIEFISTVIDVKEIDKKIYCTIDGSRLDIDPFFHKDKYEYFIEHKKETKEKCETSQIVSGFTCLEKDILFPINEDFKIGKGDILHFYRVGAYTMTLTPNFIRTIPPVYVKTKEKNYILVREKLSIDQWMCNSKVSMEE